MRQSAVTLHLYRLLAELEGDGDINNNLEAELRQDLKRTFRPEFLNRVDEICLFKPLNQAQLEGIVRLSIAHTKARLAAQHATLEPSEAAIALIARASYDPVYGARPLKRYIQRHVETPLARLILAGDVPEHSRIMLDANDDELSFNVVRP